MKDLVLNFGTQGGKSCNITISGAKPDLTADEVRALGNAFTKDGIITGKGGSITRLNAAKYVEKTEEKFDIK